MPADPAKIRWKIDRLVLGRERRRDPRLEDAVALGDPAASQRRSSAG